MRTTLTVLAASTALAAPIGAPAWSATQAPADGGLRPFAALFVEGPQAIPLVLASEDDDGDRGWREGSQRGHDDEDHEDECDDDDDDDCPGAARNPAPAGTVAPPQNGLFGNGAPPQVQVN